MADDETTVSTGGEETPAESGSGETTTPEGGATETEGTEGAKEEGTSKGGGYDDLPDHAKEIIKRQTGKAKAAERRAIEAEAKAQALEQFTSQQPTPAEEVDEDTKARIEEFQKLAPKAGYISRDEVDDIVAEKLGAVEKQQQADKDREDLKETLGKFDGKALPKITVDEIQDFLEGASRDPAQQHWTAPSVPFEAIAREVKRKEIQQMEVDRLLKSGGATPPSVEKGAESTKAPSKNVPRFDNMAEMQAHLKTIG